MAIDRVPALKRCRSLGLEPAVVGLAKESFRQPHHTNHKVSEYGAQLKEKQKAKFIYGVLEKQFRLYYEKAKKMPGITGENLLLLLERRLDNVVYRMGLATTRRQARQLVNHGHVAVNGKRVDIPSALIKVGDEVSVIENSRGKAYFKGMNEKLAAVTAPAWIIVNAEALCAKIDRFPTREEIDVPVVEQSIVELYSK